MPADASIYQNFLRAPKSVQDYDNEAMQAQQNALALQNAKIQQNALQQQQADSATYRNALKGFGSDATANYNTLIRAGLGAQAEAYKKNATDQEKVKADADKARFDAAAKKIDIAGQAFNYVRLNPTLDNANAVIDYLGQNGIYSPEQVAQYKAQVQQNPDGIGNLAEMAFRSALKTKEQLANIQTRNLGGTTDTLSIDPVTGATKTVNSVRNTVSPGDLLQAETTRRGQDLTDKRARDFNAVQVEANNIKRDEKNATQDLTKNSQIASFDTMLGTLDRLSKHPGLSRSVGIVGALPTMPGSDSANFQAELNTFQSQAFLPMVAQLKGMGALSDAEGKKLTAAVGALDPKMGEQAFRDSVARITSDMEDARARVSGQPRTPKPKLSAQDQQAEDWANANPNDPRAAQIKKRLGL